MTMQPTPATRHLVFVLDMFVTAHAGTESQFLKLAHGLLARGHRLSVGLLRDSALLRQQLPGAEIVDLRAGKIAAPASWWRIFCFLRLQRRAGAQVVQVMFNDASLMVPPLARLLGMRTIITRLDMGFWYTSTLVRLLRLTRHCVSCALSNSKAVDEVTRRVEGFSPERTAVIYNGYQPPASAEPMPRSGGLRLGLVANIRPIKRMQDAIEALALLAPEFPQLELVIVGGGDPQPLQRLAAERGVAELVCFTGASTTPERWIASFDVALLCSESEGFSNAIIEYLQQGKPVVCTRTGGNPEAVVDGVNGYLYPVGDVAALAACLRPLLADQALRQRLAQAAPASVAHLTLALLLDEHQRLYQRLTERQP